MEDLQIMMAKLGLLAARAKFNRVAANVPKEKIDAILDPLEGKMWKTEGEKLAAYKTEVGDEMFATLSASPSFPELLTKWEAEYKAKVVEE